MRKGTGGIETVLRKLPEGMLAEFLRSRGSLVELAFVAIFLGMGIHMIAGGLPELMGLTPSTTVFLGVGLSVMSMAYLIGRWFGQRVQGRTLQGFFVYDVKANELVKIPRYHFADHLRGYLQGAFVENDALKQLWEKEPLKDIHKLFDQKVGTPRKELRCQQLICEATEYYVLQRLSTHLTDYFSDDRFKDDDLHTFERQDVPEVLLQNRFLDLFSRSREDRAHFVKGTFKEDRPGEQVVAIYDGSGALYERFDLILPKESKITRPGKNQIQIRTKKLILTMEVQFDGTNTVLPSEFEKYYLNLKDVFSQRPFKVVVDLKISFRAGALLSRAGWDYYHWVDSFLDSLDAHMSEETFFEAIGWEAALTTIETVMSRLKPGRADSRPSTDPQKN